MNYLEILYQKTAILIDQRSSRERALIFASILVVIFFLWKGFVFDQIFGSQEGITKNVSMLRQTINQLQGQLTDISESIRTDPVADLRQQLSLVRKENSRIERDLAELTRQLIPPHEMAELLRELINKNPGAKLLRLENLDEQAVFSKGELENQDNLIDRFQVFKHPLEIEFTASFSATRQFIKAIESLKWKIRWDSLSYEVAGFPMAKVTLVVHTLSLHRQWIGS